MTDKLVILSSQSRSLTNFRYQMICDFLAAGLEVDALAPHDAYFDATQTKLNKIGVSLAPMALRNTGLNPFQDAMFFLELLFFLRKKNAKIAFFYTIKPVIYGCLAAKYAKVPKIYAMVSGLGYLFTAHSLKQRLLRFVAKQLYRWALKGIDKVFFHNRDDADLFMDMELVKLQQVVITDGSGVDVEHFLPLPYPTITTFLFVGRLIRDKGIYEFVSAAREIKLNYPQVRFLVAGGLHDNPTALSQLALDALINEGIIEYLGEIDDVRQALQLASVFVLPSYREGLSRAALEALATARPVITTQAPGCREVVPTGENGFKVPVGDVESLVQAMRYFIEQPDKVSIMGRVGRELAVSRFSISTINQTILESMQLY